MSLYRGTSGWAFQPDREDAYAVQRLRLNLRLDPIPWMRFGVRQ